jgi:hypothetical protein
MSEHDPVERALMGAIGQAGAMLSDAMRPPRFEYTLTWWVKVNMLAREGWQLVPMGPVPGPLPGEPLYVMARQLGAADEAAELLREEQAR